MPVYGKATKKRTSSKQPGAPKKKKPLYNLVAKVPKTALTTPFYGRKTVVHKYAQANVTINGGIAGVAAAHVFRANSMFDPDFTGGGNQPLGFDQMAAMYNRFTVTHAQIRVVFSNPSTNDYRLITGIALSRDTALKTRTEYMETHSSWDILPSGSINGGTVTCMLNVDVAKFFGLKDIIDERDFSGTSTANPQHNCYFHVFAADSGGSDPGAIQSTVEIAYTAVWKEPISLSGS